MAQDRRYRLGQYEITEDGYGTLWWRSHAGMADTKRGRCLLGGKILILGPEEIQQPGSLGREFVERLKKLKGGTRPNTIAQAILYMIHSKGQKTHRSASLLT
jgi:hypothetical protein